MPSEKFPLTYKVKMSKYVYENLERIKRDKNMNDEQVIRYLINKEVGETIYGKHVDKESI